MGYWFGAKLLVFCSEKCRPDPDDDELIFVCHKLINISTTSLREDIQAVKKRLLGFQIRYQEVARPFSWKFTRKDLKEKLQLVSDSIIKQYEPVTSQNLSAKELLPRDEIQQISYDYAYT